MAQLFQGANIFDGTGMGPGSLLVEDGRIAAVLPPDAAPDGAEVISLDGGTLAPGFVDLQLNGGGGVMFNDAPNVETLSRIAAAHAALGSLTILPTLITDTPEQTRTAVDAVADAIAAGIPGIVGLHLEGPHLSIARKGAHDPALIRPMGEGDLAFLCDAARRLPRLMVTLAPESVTDDQIARLDRADIIVSLGHTDAGFDRCVSAARAGARLATHLFNAMSQLGNREPGLVGAVLATGALNAGLIADGIHVHPQTMQMALAAKAGPGEIFLVSDAMAPAGSDIERFSLNGRDIRRVDGRLTLADGTLAGADLSMTRAVRIMCRDVGLPLDRALAMSTSIPARVLGMSDRTGVLAAGRDADFVHLSEDLVLRKVWQKGVSIKSLPE